MSALDTAVFLSLNADASSPYWLLQMARFGSLILPAVLIGCTGLTLLSRDGRQRDLAVRVLLAMALAWLAARGIQALWPMPRPFVLGLGTAWLPHGGSAAFPSTHASVAVAFGVASALALQSPVARTGVMLLALWVSWSRISLGLHFPSDVLAALLVGTCAALAVQWVPQRRPVQNYAAATGEP